MAGNSALVLCDLCVLLSKSFFPSARREEIDSRIEMRITPSEIAVAQTLSYLKATGLKRAFLIDFAVAKLVDGIKRLSR